ncbi:MAG: Holo-(acyl-carrier-protein) synthase [Firmicutes bacterium]|nr:Holo-(acyl-carrier-protein) synthase [Bacillota bacterium]
MIVGIGIDIVEIDRIASALKQPRFAGRVFTEKEQAYCDSRKSQRVASYAARFAAKEAVLKALGTGMTGGKWLDLEVLPDKAGRPVVELGGYYLNLARQKGISQIHISLTHAQAWAAAQVVLWGGLTSEGNYSS